MAIIGSESGEPIYWNPGPLELWRVEEPWRFEMQLPCFFAYFFFYIFKTLKTFQCFFFWAAQRALHGPAGDP